MGERCHSTTSISEADAISANGAAVWRMAPQTSLKNGCPVLAETTAVIRATLRIS